MALVDVVSGLLRVAIDFNAVRSDPTGRDRYQLSYNASFANTDTVGDTTAFHVRCLFHETVTVTTTGVVLSLASDTAPMGTLGTNVPSDDPEGGLLKVLAFYNHSPANANGRAVYAAINDTGLNPIVGAPAVDYDTQAAPPVNTALLINPQGLHLFVSPQGSSAMNDGTDDEIKVKTLTGTAAFEVLYITS
jgi:hypothetical protein